MQVPQAAAGSTADLPPAGGAESSNNGFAIWDKHGTLLLADRYGREIPFQTASGFHNNRAAWQGSAWRYLYLHDEHSGRTVAVSQRLKSVSPPSPMLCGCSLRSPFYRCPYCCG